MLLPVLARVLPFSSVPAARAVGMATSTASKLVLFRRNIAWAVTRRFGPSAVPGVLLGAYLLSARGLLTFFNYFADKAVCYRLGL